jgi:tetratricopeptide (TPR) repeat protein
MFSYWLLSLPAFFAAPASAGAQSEALDLNRRALEAEARRDFTSAERQFRAEAAIYRTLGTDYERHLSIALFNLAEAVYAKGDWSGSHAIFDESLSLSRRAFGPKHVRTVADLNAIGHVEMILGDTESATARFTEALAITRELYPRDLQHAYSLAGFASLRLRAGDAEAAIPFADEALHVMTVSDPGEGAESALMYQLAGQVQRLAGRNERALPLLRKARALYEKSHATGDPRYAILLSQQGLALMEDGKFGAASAEMQRAVALLEPCSGCAFELAVARNNLGVLRLRQKKYAEAGDLLRNALNAEERLSPAAGPELAATRKALEELRSALR